VTAGRLVAAVLLGTSLAGCAALGLGRVEGDAGTAGLFVGRAWIDADPAAAPGALRLWSAGGTLVMASCAETPRVATWRWTGSSTFEWREDGVAIPAEIALVGPDELVLLLGLNSGEETRRYRAAAEGPLCG
jgi:hypothetical protein